MSEPNIELTPLQFSACKPRYESTASYTNSKNQSFLIRVSGDEQRLVEKYTKNLQVNLELTPSELTDISDREIFENLEGDEIISELKEKYLEISLEPIQGIDLSSPTKLEFALGNSVNAVGIDKGEIHHTKPTNKKIKSVTLTITVKRGTITVKWLTRKNANSPGRILESKTEKFSVGEYVRTVFSQESEAFFALQIFGEKKETEYFIEGQIKVLHEGDLK
jgi:hypothetical protein